MTLPTNDDFTNSELSIEELEAIAAGWPHWLHAAVHGIERGASAVYDVAASGPGQAVAYVMTLVAGAILAGPQLKWINSMSNQN